MKRNEKEGEGMYGRKHSKKLLMVILLVAIVILGEGCFLPETVELDTDAKGVLETQESDEPFLLSPAKIEVRQIPEYSGNAYVEINENEPFFAEKRLPVQSFEAYSELDNLGRCGACTANLGVDIMPTQPRGKIGQVKPSGWHTVKYNDLIEGNYLYNRCHLIAYQLAGENANEKNLITGTRYMNIEGMKPFEDMVAEYIKATENHVLYRVTPVFEGDNLVASGVLMEGMSVEDGGEAIQFCVYCYNVQPGIVINYANGKSKRNESTKEGVTKEAKEPEGTAYVLNKNTKKFHYAWCLSVEDISAKNRIDVVATREDLINRGYQPCKGCNP